MTAKIIFYLVLGGEISATFHDVNHNLNPNLRFLITP